MAELFQVQPFVGCSFERAEVEIEPVDVDVCARILAPPEKQKPPRGGFVPCAEAAGVVRDEFSLKSGNLSICGDI